MKVYGTEMTLAKAKKINKDCINKLTRKLVAVSFIAGLGHGPKGTGNGISITQHAPTIRSIFHALLVSVRAIGQTRGN